MNIDKWLKACQYLKSEYENLNVDEQSAIDILCDFWRRDYSTSLVEECESQMQVLKDGHKYHGNNKTIIEKSKELCAVATAMLKDAASFGEFKAEMQKLSRGSSSRSSSSASRSSSSSSSSSSSRPSAPRPSSSKPSVVIRSVEFRATGANNVALGTSSSTVPVGTHYVYPVLKFDALQADTDIWYKIYDGAGVLITGTRRQGFSTVGQFKRGATGGECIGIGSEDGSNYATTGVGRIEFFALSTPIVSNMSSSLVPLLARRVAALHARVRAATAALMRVCVALIPAAAPIPVLRDKLVSPESSGGLIRYGSLWR